MGTKDSRRSYESTSEEDKLVSRPHFVPDSLLPNRLQAHNSERKTRCFHEEFFGKQLFLLPLFLTIYLVTPMPCSCGRPCDRRFITQPMGPQVSPFPPKSWAPVQTQGCVTMLPMPLNFPPVLWLLSAPHWPRPRDSGA